MNAIAFSLWGDNPKYTDGASKNLWLAKQIYPDWTVHFWAHSSVDPLRIDSLRFGGAFVHEMVPGIAGLYHQRFLVHDLDYVDRYIVRDTDSRLSHREKQCVDEWVASGKLLHTIHDHPYHTICNPIMGGLWGFWKDARKPQISMQRLLEKSPHGRLSKYGADQDFLRDEIWSRYEHSSFQHGRKIPMPPPDPKDPDSFLGEVWENGQPRSDHREMKKR